MDTITKKITQNDFRQFKHIHIIGVCGTLMGAFAVYLKRLGIRFREVIKIFIHR
jgi:hypothetical protein